MLCLLYDSYYKLVSFRGLYKLRPRPDWSLLGVKFKISDEHPRPFYMGVPPPGAQQWAKYSSLHTHWVENHQPQRTQISTITNVPFIQDSNRMASRLTATASFPSVVFQLLQYSKQHPSFSTHRAALMTKPNLTYPAFSLRFVDFAIQFCFRCKFSFHGKRRSSQVWQWRDFPPQTNSLLRIATNEIAWICIDNRLRQMAFFVFAKVGKGRLSSYVERFWNKKKLYL